MPTAGAPRVALMVAPKTEGRAQSTPEREPALKVDQIEELMTIVGEPPPRVPRCCRSRGGDGGARPAGPHPIQQAGG